MDEGQRQGYSEAGRTQYERRKKTIRLTTKTSKMLTVETAVTPENLAADGGTDLMDLERGAKPDGLRPRYL